MREFAQLLNEDHRYFPEWADRPGIPGPPVEADHNSYLAGGYSEEFGYHVSADRPPVSTPLEGDPDASRLWYVQVIGLHPGYPECGRPNDRDSFSRAQAGLIPTRDSAAKLRDSMRPIRVIRVGERARKAAQHDGLTARLTSLWARWRSARREFDH